MTRQDFVQTVRERIASLRRAQFEHLGLDAGVSPHQEIARIEAFWAEASWADHELEDHRTGQIEALDWVLSLLGAASGSAPSPP